ncbi:hypothetical protein DH2020_012760 [Rehmannia glutinosa]|uniref:HIG1 domain-containing protein n=1 Tax=Rehmannia glutinosa TaxID=99300 RepID=A0ABR0X2T5_REHGL
MAESTSVKSRFISIREWIDENKLRTVGSLWASGVIGSLAYNWSQPGKTSVKIIHARLHAQALTLAALAGAAVFEYYDHKSEGKSTDRYSKVSSCGYLLKGLDGL